MIVLLPKSQTRHPAVRSFSWAYKVTQSPHENMPGANTRSVLARFCDNNWEKGKDFVKNFFHQKTRVGKGRKCERMLNDLFVIWVTV